MARKIKILTLKIFLIAFTVIIIMDLIIWIPGFFSENFETRFIAKKELRETIITLLIICAIYYLLRKEKNKIS